MKATPLATQSFASTEGQFAAHTVAAIGVTSDLVIVDSTEKVTTD